MNLPKKLRKQALIKLARLGPEEKRRRVARAMAAERERCLYLTPPVESAEAVRTKMPVTDWTQFRRQSHSKPSTRTPRPAVPKEWRPTPPTMLTPDELEWLRQSKTEANAFMRETFEPKPLTGGRPMETVHVDVSKKHAPPGFLGCWTPPGSYYVKMTPEQAAAFRAQESLCSASLATSSTLVESAAE